MGATLERSVAIRGEPPRTTAQEKRIAGKKPNGAYKFYKDPKLQVAEDWYCVNLMKSRPPEPLNTAIKLEVLWAYGTKDRKKDKKPKTTRPDTDNMVKLLKDCLTKCGYWKDDALVTDEHLQKIWSVDKPGVYIKIYRIEEEKIA